MTLCWKCHSENDLVLPLSFRAECSFCLAYLHVCKNCRFYDPQKSKACRIPESELVADKEHLNHCEFFQLKEREGKKSPGVQENSLAQDRFKDLFKDS